MSHIHEGRFIAAACALALAACLLPLDSLDGAAGFAAATPQKNKKKGEPPAARAPLVEERGKFRVLVDGKDAGSEEFEIRSDGGGWVARGTAEVALGEGASSKVTGKLELGPDAAPLRYEWSTTAPKKAAASVVFTGNVATTELRLEGASPYTQEFRFESPHVLILDNNMYHQYAILARLYDWEHKEPKTYSVLIPQDLTPGSVLVEYAGPQVVEGQKLEMIRVRSADLEVELYCEGARLVRIVSPASKAEIIREPAGK
jgi:hypothetical protein